MIVSVKKHLLANLLARTHAPLDAVAVFSVGGVAVLVAQLAATEF